MMKYLVSSAVLTKTVGLVKPQVRGRHALHVYTRDLLKKKSTSKNL